MFSYFRHQSYKCCRGLFRRRFGIDRDSVVLRRRIFGTDETKYLVLYNRCVPFKYGFEVLKGEIVYLELVIHPVVFVGCRF